MLLLPNGVDRDLGLRKALAKLNLSPDEVIAVGNRENDLPLLQLCGLSVSVNNALPMLKEASDWVMTKDCGDGSLLVRFRIERSLYSTNNIF